MAETLETRNDATSTETQKVEVPQNQDKKKLAVRGFTREEANEIDDILLRRGDDTVFDALTGFDDLIERQGNQVTEQEDDYFKDPLLSSDVGNPLSKQVYNTAARYVDRGENTEYQKVDLKITDEDLTLLVIASQVGYESLNTVEKERFNSVVGTLTDLNPSKLLDEKGDFDINRLAANLDKDSYLKIKEELTRQTSRSVYIAHQLKDSFDYNESSVLGEERISEVSKALNGQKLEDIRAAAIHLVKLDPPRTPEEEAFLRQSVKENGTIDGAVKLLEKRLADLEEKVGPGVFGLPLSSLVLGYEARRPLLEKAIVGLANEIDQGAQTNRTVAGAGGAIAGGMLGIATIKARKFAENKKMYDQQVQDIDKKLDKQFKGKTIEDVKDRAERLSNGRNQAETAYLRNQNPNSKKAFDKATARSEQANKNLVEYQSLVDKKNHYNGALANDKKKSSAYQFSLIPEDPLMKMACWGR